MAEEYKEGENYINDIIISLFSKYKYSISNELTIDLFDTLSSFITNVYYENGVADIDVDKYLKFDIKQNKSNIRFIAKNFICALWLSQIFPINCELVLKHNYFYFENIEYQFDDKNLKLIKK